jgi:hypothetical protein
LEDIFVSIDRRSGFRATLSSLHPRFNNNYLIIFMYIWVLFVNLMFWVIFLCFRFRITYWLTLRRIQRTPDWLFPCYTSAITTAETLMLFSWRTFFRMKLILSICKLRNAIMTFRNLFALVYTNFVNIFP